MRPDPTRVDALGAEPELSERRATFLANAGVVLASSLDYATTLQRLAALAVPELADYCVVDLVNDDGQVSRVASAYGDQRDQKLVEALRRFPPGTNPRDPVERTLVTGEPQIAANVGRRDAAGDCARPRASRAHARVTAVRSAPPRG